jgi:cytochrome c-type biogenesis protein CcmH
MRTRSVRKVARKPRRTFFRALAICTLGIAPIAAALALADPVALTPGQEEQVDRLCRQLISPCCWTTSVADHGTGMAPLIEDTVRTMVASGASDDDVLDHFVASFGERILAEPRHRGFNRIGYWMPWLAAFAGLAIIVRFVRRHRVPPPKPVEASIPVDPNRARISEELRRLDG